MRITSRNTYNFVSYKVIKSFGREGLNRIRTRIRSDTFSLRVFLKNYNNMIGLNWDENLGQIRYQITYQIRHYEDISLTTSMNLLLFHVIFFIITIWLLITWIKKSSSWSISLLLRPSDIVFTFKRKLCN